MKSSTTTNFLILASSVLVLFTGFVVDVATAARIRGASSSSLSSSSSSSEYESIHTTIPQSSEVEVTAAASAAAAAANTRRNRKSLMRRSLFQENPKASDQVVYSNNKETATVISASPSPIPTKGADYDPSKQERLNSTTPSTSPTTAAVDNNDKGDDKEDDAKKDEDKDEDNTDKDNQTDKNDNDDRKKQKDAIVVKPQESIESVNSNVELPMTRGIGNRFGSNSNNGSSSSSSSAAPEKSGLLGQGRGENLVPPAPNKKKVGDLRKPQFTTTARFSTGDRGNSNINATNKADAAPKKTRNADNAPFYKSAVSPSSSSSNKKKSSKRNGNGAIGKVEKKDFKMDKKTKSGKSSSKKAEEKSKKPKTTNGIKVAKKLKKYGE